MLGANLLTQRKLLKLTQAGMAAALGINVRTYIRWEKSEEPLAPRIVNMVEAVVARRAAEVPRRDGRFKPPPEGKYLRIFRARDGMELTDRIQDNATPRERRQPGFGYIKSLEFAQQRYSQWPCVSAEDRGDHYALTLDCP